MFVSLKQSINSILLTLLSKFPKNNKIVFVNFWGRGYGDNLKYIADEILSRNLSFDLVWLVGDMSLAFPNGIRKVKYYSLKSKFELSTAKVIISNAKGILPYVKTHSQYYIQTWHGGFPLKYIEKEAENDLSEEYVRNSMFDSSITDLIISGSDFQTEIIEKSFWYEGEIFKHGIPRNDIFFNFTEDKICKIKHKLGFVKNDRIVTYVPTFRDNNKISAYNLDPVSLLATLHKKTGYQWKLIIRLHPNVACQSNFFDYGENVINGTVYDDPQELLLISDVLITDYSSIMMDFAIMKKPVFLFATDLEHYVSACRNLRPIFYKLPFDLCTSNEILYNKIKDFDIKTYLERLNSFLEIYYKSYDDGRASKHVVDRIEKVMEQL